MPVGCPLSTKLVVLILASSSNTNSILTSLLIVLIAAKLGDEIFKRLGQPTVVGEILAGALIGPSVFGFVEIDTTLHVFAELGVVFLLFWVGLETRLSSLLSVGRSAAAVGILGVCVPFAVGYGFGLIRGDTTATSLFLGAALVATSVGITSAVLLEMGLINRRTSRIILGAAIVDDILAMILVAVASGVTTKGSVDVLSIALVLAMSISFLVFFAVGGTRLLARMPDLLDAPRFANSPVMPAVLICLSLAAIAAQIGLAAIIGAFLAGMIIAETKDHNDIEAEIAPLYAFFTPFFFVTIGLQLDLSALATGSALGLLAVLLALAISSKFVGAWLGSRLTGLNSRKASFVGVGMIPRGEVGIIVAGIGVSTHALNPSMFTELVAMSIITTLIVPPALKLMLKRHPEPPIGQSSRLKR